MEKKEFSACRSYLNKTQKQMAQLLGVSLKAIQSFEQGWRNVPVHVERQILFLLARKAGNNKNKACWKLSKCSLEQRRNCPAWEFQVGSLCWFINGTICQGEAITSWPDKMKMCRSCRVFQAMMPAVPGLNAKA